MPGIAALCISYVFSQFYRAFLAVLTPVLSMELGMTATEFAYASGAWFIAFALFQFPVGILLDSIGPRRTAGFIFTAFAGGGTFLFAVSTSPMMIIVAMALIGIGCSVALMAPMYIFVRTFDPKKFAALVSAFVGIGSLGNIASSAPLAFAVESFGWRETCLALGIVTLLVGVVVLILVRDPERILQQDGNGKGGYRQLFAIRQLWFIFPMILCGYMAAAGLRGSWIGPFHADLYGYNTLQIGQATLFMSIALVLGTFFYGPMDRIFDSRKKVVLAGNVSVLICCVAAVIWFPSQAVWGTVVFVLIGFLGASYAVQMAHGKSFVPQHLTGRGVTLLNFCSIGGAGLFQWISGVVVKASQVPGDPVVGYRALFIFYAVLLIAAIGIYAFSQDAKPSDPS